MSVVAPSRDAAVAAAEAERRPSTLRRERILAAAWYGVLAAMVLHPVLRPGYLFLLDWTPTPTSLGPTIGPFAIHDAPLLAVLELIPIPTWILQRLILVGAVWGAGMAAYLTAPVHRAVARFFAGSLYALTPFVFSRMLAGHWRLLVAYALAPLAVRTIIRLAREPSVRSGAAAGLWIVGVATVAAHGIVLLGVAAVGFVVALAAGRDRRGAVMGFGAATAIVAVGTAWWLVPAMVHGAPPGASAVDVYRSVPVGEASLPLTLLGMRGFWIPRFNPAEPSVWPFLAIGLVALTLAGMAVAVRDERRPLALVLLVSAGVALVVSMGVASPVTAPVARALYRWVPGWIVLREPQKAIALLALAHAWFGAVAVEWMLARRLSTVRAAAMAMLAVPFVFTPQILGGLGGRLDPEFYPASWSEAEQLFRADPDRFSVLALPWQLYIPLPWIDPGETAMDPAREYFSPPVVAGDDPQTGLGPIPRDGLDPFIESLIASHDTHRRMGAELAPLGIKYVLLVPGRVPRNYRFVYAQDDLEVVLSSPELVVFRNAAWDTRSGLKSGRDLTD